MEFRRNDSEGAELYCTEKATFTPFSSHSRKWENPKHVASTPYHPAPLTSEKYDTSSNPITDSSDDPILNDFRVVQYMLESEINNDRTSSRYLRTTHVNDNMRKILLRWMYEVVIDQKCEDLLFVLAANFLDRFLNSVTVEKGQLQLLGCCCLLLASKLRNSHIISADMLAYLTDGCHTDDDICKFELVLLSQLGWNMSPVLASDYLEPVIRQAGLSHVFAIQRHARSFLSMATLYSCFLDYRPSFLACATVYAALTYCEGRDTEEVILLDFVEKNFSISRQDLARARALIFSSMETELSLQGDDDQETAVLPAFADRRDGASEQDNSCSEVSSSATLDVSDASCASHGDGLASVSVDSGVACSSSNTNSSHSIGDCINSWPSLNGSSSIESGNINFDGNVSSSTNSKSEPSNDKNNSFHHSSSNNTTSNSVNCVVGDLTPNDVMEVTAYSPTITKWFSINLSFLKQYLYSSILPLFGGLVIPSRKQQLSEINKLKLYRGLKNINRNLFREWTPTCDASVMALMTLLTKGSKGSVFKRVPRDNNYSTDVTQECKQEGFDDDVMINNIRNLEMNAVQMDCNFAVGCHDKDGFGPFECDINGEFINCINFEEEHEEHGHHD